MKTAGFTRIAAILLVGSGVLGSMFFWRPRSPDGPATEVRVRRMGLSDQSMRIERQERSTPCVTDTSRSRAAVAEHSERLARFEASTVSIDGPSGSVAGNPAALVSKALESPTAIWTRGSIANAGARSWCRETLSPATRVYERC